MIQLADIPTKAKAWAGVVTSVAAVVAICVASYGHFMTDAEAADQHQQIVQEQESYRAQQYRADKADRLDRFQREIDRIDFQLISDDLPDRQREYLTNKRHDIERKMACVEKDDC